MFRIFALSLTGLTVFGLAACTPAAPGASLAGNLWILNEINGEAALAGTTISAEFSDDGRAAGSAGCNRYTTSYTVSGEDLTFSQPMAATLMACDEPVMLQEAAYFQVLAATATFQIEGEALTLFDLGGEALAVFELQSQDLAGSSWEVISYNTGMEAVVSLIIDTQITAIFGEDGQLTGSAGCNNYFAPYETEGSSITIGAAGSTRMFCAEPEGIMEQEAAYLAALQTAATYQIEGSRMEMRTADGALVAVFDRSASQ